MIDTTPPASPHPGPRPTVRAAQRGTVPAMVGVVIGSARQARRGLRAAAAGMLLLLPEIAVGLLLFDAAKAAHLRRLDGEHPERGDAIQWVVVTAIGAAIAIT